MNKKCPHGAHESRSLRLLIVTVRTSALLVLSSFSSQHSLAVDNPALQGDDYSSGTGSVSVAYQSIKVNDFNTGAGDVNIGEVLTHTYYVELDYSLTDRWQVKAGLPYIKKKYNGPGRHNPLTLVPPRPEVPFIDDGSYHSDFQDFFIGVNYLWLNEPVILEPFVNLFIPSHDYPHFANSAVGQNLWKAEVGLELTHFILFSNWYYRVETSYTFVEKTLGVNVNHARLNGELGRFFAERFAANLFVQSKLGRGDQATAFPPGSRTNERWYQHDRTTRHNYLNIGMGADWFFLDRYQLSGSAFTTIWGDSVHLVELAWGIGITRYF